MYVPARIAPKRKVRKSGRAGAIIVWAAVCLVVAVIFLAFSIDYGRMVVTESELQNAADAAALSAARRLSSGRAETLAAAELWAAKNVAAGVPVTLVAGEDVHLGYWNEDTAEFIVVPPGSSQTANAVRVVCKRSSARGNPLNLFFAPIFGIHTADLEASAIARSQTSRCGLIIGIPSVTMSGSSHTDSYRSADGPYSPATARAGGHVCSNGQISMSGSTAIRGDAHPGPGQIVKSSSSVGVLGAITPLQTPLSFPPTDPGDAPSNNDNSKIPLSLGGAQPLNAKGEFSLSGGDIVNLPPGRYFLSKLTLSGGSTISISGPTTIYVTGDVSLSGGSLANTTFLPKNLQLFPMGSKCVISGDSAFYGVVYAPYTEVVRSGDSDYFGSIIAAKLTLSGSGGIHADESLDSLNVGGAASRAALVQ